MGDHHSTTRASALKKDRDRQKRRRDDLKGQGAPTTHILNRAIAEGVFYSIDAARAQGVAINDMQLSVRDVMGYAAKVLTRHTNGTDHYSGPAVVEAIGKRIRNKSMSKFRIKPTWAESDLD